MGRTIADSLAMINAVYSGTVRKPYALVLVTALATPIGLLAETQLAPRLLPADFGVITSMLEPLPRVAGWVTAALSGLGLLVLPFVLRALYRRGIDKQRRRGVSIDQSKAWVETFFLTSSVVQVPALLASLCHLLGGTLAPTVVSVALSVIGVLLLAVLPVEQREQT